MDRLCLLSSLNLGVAHDQNIKELLESALHSIYFTFILCSPIQSVCTGMKRTCGGCQLSIKTDQLSHSTSQCTGQNL